MESDLRLVFPFNVTYYMLAYVFAFFFTLNTYCVILLGLQNLRISFPSLKLLYLENGQKMTIFQATFQLTLLRFFFELRHTYLSEKEYELFPLKLSISKN